MNKRRDYSDAELALFASYTEERAAVMPDQCTGGDQCWVKRGPPAFSSDGVCGECRTLPTTLWIDARGSRRRFLQLRKFRR
jgi:hypothetical protein